MVILGNGLLGSELKKDLNCSIISREQDGFDIEKPELWSNFLIESAHGTIFWPKYKVIINCIGHTDTYEDKRDTHWKVNYEGVVNLVDFCNRNDIKLVQFVTDYIYSGSIENATEEDVPVHNSNWYGYTKLLADAYVQLRSKKYLLIRATHKEFPFKYEQAWVNQIGTFDYIDKISKLSSELIKKDVCGVFNVGTPIKSMYELAQRTKFDVKGVIAPSEVPIDLVVSLDKLTNFFEKGE